MSIDSMNSAGLFPEFVSRKGQGPQPDSLEASGLSLPLLHLILFDPLTHTNPSSIWSSVSPYQDLEKATVLQECRVFHDSNIVTTNPRLCCQLITKLLHILTQVCPHP